MKFLIDLVISDCPFLCCWFICLLKVFCTVPRTMSVMFLTAFLACCLGPAFPDHLIVFSTAFFR